MKMHACCVLLSSMILLSGCSLPQTCCSCYSYCDAPPIASDADFNPGVEPPPAATDVQPPAEQLLPLVPAASDFRLTGSASGRIVKEQSVSYWITTN